MKDVTWLIGWQTFLLQNLISFWRQLLLKSAEDKQPLSRGIPLSFTHRRECLFQDYSCYDAFGLSKDKRWHASCKGMPIYTVLNELTKCCRIYQLRLVLNLRNSPTKNIYNEWMKMLPIWTEPAAPKSALLSFKASSSPGRTPLCCLGPGTGQQTKNPLLSTSSFMSLVWTVSHRLKKSFTFVLLSQECMCTRVGSKVGVELEGWTRQNPRSGAPR